MCLSGRLGEVNLSACSVAEIVPCNNARQSLSKLVRRSCLPHSTVPAALLNQGDRIHERWYLCNVDVEVHVLCRILAVVFSDVPHYLQIVAKTALWCKISHDGELSRTFLSTLTVIHPATTPL